MMEDVIQLGILYVKEGNFQEGFRLLKEAMVKFHGTGQQKAPAALQSYYGLCLATLNHDVKNGIEHCRVALKREFFLPDLYLNLGKVYLLANQKANAVHVFYKGLKLDDDHRGICSELQRLGLRENPVISFLPRSHYINRILGQLRFRMKS
jgi:tetratricopeptide (TPR) repeat protein